MEMREAAATGGRLSAMELVTHMPLEYSIWYTFEGVISANQMMGSQWSRTHKSSLSYLVAAGVINKIPRDIHTIDLKRQLLPAVQKAQIQDALSGICRVVKLETCSTSTRCLGGPERKDPACRVWQLLNGQHHPSRHP
jgi:hypothetical protein